MAPNLFRKTNKLADPNHPFAKCFHVVSPSPRIIIKFAEEHSEEVILPARNLVHSFLESYIVLLFSSPIQRIFRLRHEPKMNPRAAGVTLRDVVDTTSLSELDHIAEQLKSFLTHIETITSPTNTMGSVMGGPYHNTFWPDGLAPEKSFATLEGFVGYYRWMILFGQCIEAWTESVESPNYPKKRLFNSLTLTSFRRTSLSKGQRSLVY
ncbi:hypothetical protein IW262DRAFT_1451118 [Armillaria fumosa]|nr:hypothetical protein IW262DRAFT_1451118 [Armillaria fumosa]